MRLYIGIDPGVSGGIAVLEEDGYVFDVVKMPSTDWDIVEVLRGADIYAKSFAYIESVHSMPGQGVVSTATFMEGYGVLRGILTTIRIPYEKVAPGKWQRAMGILAIKGEGKTAHKNRTKAKAQELFPELTVTHATADALLIAEYGRRLNNGQLHG